MRQRFRKQLWFLYVLAVMASAVSARADDEKITIYTEEWAPYNYSEKGELKGFAIEILQAMLVRLEADVKVKLYPSARSLKLMEKGPHTMFISMFRTPEREAQYQWVGPLIDASIYFYKRRGDARMIQTMGDVRKVDLIASRHAGLVHDRLMAEGFDNLDDTAKNAWEVYKKLLAGRCDLAISDAPLGVAHILEKLGQPLDILTKTPVKLVDRELYIAVHKDVSSKIVMRWQQVLDELKQSGLYDQIVQKYRGDV